MDWPAHGGHVRPRWGGSAGFLGRRASRGITSLLASTAAAEGRGGEGEGKGGGGRVRNAVGWKRRQRSRNKRSPAGLPPTVPREITRRTPPASAAYS